MTEEEILKYLESQGYENLRIFADGICGVMKMIYTYGLCVDMDQHGVSKRYCYETKAEAIQACNELKRCYDQPRAGYKAVKG